MSQCFETLGKPAVYRTANNPNPVLPAGDHHGQLCYIVNLMDDAFTFANDTVETNNVMPYVWITERKQWYSMRKMQCIFDLGREELLNRWEKAKQCQNY